MEIIQVATKWLGIGVSAVAISAICVFLAVLLREVLRRY